MAKDELSPQQRAFCQHFIVHLNATHAAIEAGYSKKGASVRGSELLALRKVRDAVNQLLEKRSEKVGIKAEHVLERLDSIGDADMAECFTPTGALKNIHDIPKELRKCIASIEVFEVEEFNHDTKTMEKIGETKKIKFWDKIRANELIGRNLKLFSEKIDVKHTHTLESLVAGSTDVTPKQLKGDE